MGAAAAKLFPFLVISLGGVVGYFGILAAVSAFAYKCPADDTKAGTVQAIVGSIMALVLATFIIWFGGVVREWELTIPDFSHGGGSELGEAAAGSFNEWAKTSLWLTVWCGLSVPVLVWVQSSVLGPIRSCQLRNNFFGKVDKTLSTWQPLVWGVYGFIAFFLLMSLVFTLKWRHKLNEAHGKRGATHALGQAFQEAAQHFGYGEKQEAVVSEAPHEDWDVNALVSPGGRWQTGQDYITEKVSTVEGLLNIEAG